jgi:hypothetical protein
MTAYSASRRRGMTVTRSRDSEAVLIAVLTLAATAIAFWDLLLLALAAG